MGMLSCRASLSRLQSGNLLPRYSKAAGSRKIAFRDLKRFKTECTLKRLHTDRALGVEDERFVLHTNRKRR